jgi:hypothetical protein
MRRIEQLKEDLFKIELTDGNDLSVKEEQEISDQQDKGAFQSNRTKKNEIKKMGLSAKSYSEELQSETKNYGELRTVEAKDELNRNTILPLFQKLKNLIALVGIDLLNNKITDRQKSEKIINLIFHCEELDLEFLNYRNINPLSLNDKMIRVFDAMIFVPIFNMVNKTLQFT